jgi:hypothetical protein
MSRKTHRLLITCAVLAMLAAPVETVLLAAMRVPDATAAAREWATGLSVSELQDAALHIQSYPYFYRRAIMTALEPEARSQVWRRYLASYTSAHPNMDVTARALIGRASAAMTPEVFDDNPPADRIAELANVFEVSLSVFGRRTATDLFMRLGSDDTSYEALPISERVTGAVREWITVHAGAADCDCAAQFPTSCDVSGAIGDTCADAMGCEPLVTWPACGVAWAVPCNGLCSTMSRQAR